MEATQTNENKLNVDTDHQTKQSKTPYPKYVCVWVVYNKIRFVAHVCMYQSSNLSVCMFVCLYVSLFVCMSVCLSVCSCVCLSVCLYARVCLSLSLSVYIYIYIWRDDGGDDGGAP